MSLLGYVYTDQFKTDVKLDPNGKSTLDRLSVCMETSRNFCSRTCPEWIQTDQTLGLLFCRSSSGSVAALFQKQPVKARCLHGTIWETTQEWFQIVSCKQKQIQSVLVWNDSSLVPCEHSLNCFGAKAPYKCIHSIPKFNQL